MDYRKCDICGCKHLSLNLIRINALNLKESEDDFICYRCKVELSNFARSMQAIADKVRMAAYKESNG